MGIKGKKGVIIYLLKAAYYHQEVFIALRIFLPSPSHPASEEKASLFVWIKDSHT